MHRPHGLVYVYMNGKNEKNCLKKSENANIFIPEKVRRIPAEEKWFNAKSVVRKNY